MAYGLQTPSTGAVPTGELHEDVPPRGDRYKQDKNKPMWDLLPIWALAEVVDVLTFGAEKYGPHSWRDCPDYKGRYVAAALRHIAGWRKGATYDSETGLHPIAHAICSLLFILELERLEEKNAVRGSVGCDNERDVGPVPRAGVPVSGGGDMLSRRIPCLRNPGC